jgi:hypothetical protein
VDVKRKRFVGLVRLSSMGLPISCTLSEVKNWESKGVKGLELENKFLILVPSKKLKFSRGSSILDKLRSSTPLKVSDPSPSLDVLSSFSLLGDIIY